MLWFCALGSLAAASWPARGGRTPVSAADDNKATASAAVLRPSQLGPISVAAADPTAAESPGGPERSIPPTAEAIVSVAVPTSPAAPSAPRRFVVLGDSLSAWAFEPDSPYHSTSGTWPSLLAAQDPGLVLVNNAGVPGNTTTQMLARMQRDVLDYSPDILFVLGGTNDVGTDVPTSITVDNLTKIVETARAHGISVVLLTIPPDNDDYAYREVARRELNSELAALARGEGIRLVDDWAALSNQAGALEGEFAAYDGLHLTECGEQALADAVEDALNPRPLPRPV